MILGVGLSAPDGSRKRAFPPADMRRGSYDDAVASLRPHLQNLAQRRRSAPSIAFGRALGKTWTSIREEGIGQVPADQCPFVLGLTNENAELTLDERVQLTEGVKTKERQLFLFSDILVIAKLRESSSSYRLKHRVNLEQLWIVTFEDEEDEEGDVGINLKTSLFLAWPLAHCVVSFRSPEVKERWFGTLHRKIREAAERSGPLSPPPSVLMTVLSGSVASKTPAGGMDSVIQLPTDGTAPPAVKEGPLCNTEDKACRPIGKFRNRRWSFFLKKLRESSSLSVPAPSADPASPKTLLFGQQLSKVCPEEDKLPKPITDMLMLLLKKGAFAEGVFRKAANARSVKEIREQLNSGVDVDMESKPVTLLAALFKDFLRQIPGSLLVAEQYGDWMQALEREDIQERHAQLKQMIDRLPPTNGVLLRHLLCVLHHISLNVSTNKMDARNLAICIAPNLLQHHSLDTETVSKVTDLTQFLIENCREIFGEQIQSLLGDPDEEELVDNLDSRSSHQHDSAYDSTDPDAEGDSGDPAVGGPLKACGSAEEEEDEPRLPGCQDDRPTPKPLPRRRSEPALFPSAVVAGNRLGSLARSHEDFSGGLGFQEQPLKKQVSEDSFLLSGSHQRQGGAEPLAPLPLRTAPAAPQKDSSCSSSCSLESSFSNQSESSVFTSSPLPSPSCSRRSLFPRHQSFHLGKGGEDAPSPAPLPPQPEKEVKEVKEVKRRAQSMRIGGKMRVRSWSAFSRGGSLKKGDPQKEGALFPCETLQEDSLSETTLPDHAPARPRPRPLSAVEVFQQVDSRLAAKPPAYEQALLSGVQLAPPQYRTLTVRGARELERKSRPVSVSDDLLLRTHPACDLTGCHAQDTPALAPPTLAPAPPPSMFRPRAMSASAPCDPHQKVIRRCSQPLFEEISYAKESYV
ncbi:T cell activation RhoGTPase activating protein b [Anguilla rostrata]